MTAKRSDEVHTRLKQEILDWTLPPGTPLSEPELARRLGASRTPIRESLQQLSREGLVRLVPRKGAFVTDVSVPDIIELFQMRQALEAYAARLAARADGRPALRVFVPELHDAGTRLTADSNQAYYELTARLDERILQLAGNDRLGVALQQVWDQISRARRLAGSNLERLQSTVAEHVHLVEAVADGQEEVAAAAAHEHVQASLEHILQSLWRRAPASLAAASTLAQG